MDSYESASEHLERIRQLASQKWGDGQNSYGRPIWEAKLVAEYTRLENLGRPEDEQVAANGRRSQVLRAFEREGCTAETLLRLYAAVDCRIKVLQEQEV